MKEAKKTLTLAERILAKDDIPSKEISVPLWNNQKLIVKGMTGKERFALIKKCADPDGEIDGEKMTALSLVQCVKNPETGERVFSDAQAMSLMEKSVAALQDLINITNELNGLGDAATVEIEKN